MELYRFRLQTFTGCLHGEFHYSRKRHAEFLPSCPEHSQYKTGVNGHASLKKGFSFEQRYTSLTYKPVEKSSDYLNEMKEAKEDVTDRLDWIAFKNQFFSSVLIADQDFDKAP